MGKASHGTNQFKRSSSFLVPPSVFINAACIGLVLVGQETAWCNKQHRLQSWDVNPDLTDS